MIPVFLVHELNKMRDEYRRAFDGATTRINSGTLDAKSQAGLTIVRDEWRDALEAAESLVCNIPDETFRSGDFSAHYRLQKDGGLALVWGGKPKHVAIYLAYVQGGDSVARYVAAGIDGEGEGTFALSLYDGLARLVELVGKVGGYETDVTEESMMAEFGIV